jgi:hypothetical protein
MLDRSLFTWKALIPPIPINKVKDMKSRDVLQALKAFIKKHNSKLCF